MVNISKDEITTEESSREWIIRFLNLPSDQQIDFLYRSYLEEAVRMELEEKVLNYKNDKKAGE